jgi:FkbM family methyltransferase
MAGSAGQLPPTLEHRARRCYCSAMNFDDALKHYAPRAWFRFKFLKYKYLKRGEPEIHLIRHLVEPGTTAVDIGCSIGIYAAEMARYANKVIAFEANPAVARFARTVAPNNVEVINVALSSSAGRTTLTVPLNAKGRAVTELASIAPKEATGANSVAIDVETQRLDDFPIANCSFIKIDVEGHEEPVLDGASSLIAAQRPALMIELVETFNPGVVARLAGRYALLSYGCFFLSRGQLRPVVEFNAAHDQDDARLVARHKLPPGREYISNFIFLPQEKRDRLMAAR